MSQPKKECVEYVDFAKKMYTEPELIQCGSYYYNSRRMALHSAMCDAYGIVESDTKEFTDNLEHYLKRARDDWGKVAELLHEDLLSLTEKKINFEVLSPERFAELREVDWCRAFRYDWMESSHKFLLKKFRNHFLGMCDAELVKGGETGKVAVMCKDDYGEVCYFFLDKETFDEIKKEYHGGENGKVQ